MFDMINIFEVFLPQLLRYPNPTDPLNGEAAAMLMREPRTYDAKVKGTFLSLFIPVCLRVPFAPAPQASLLSCPPQEYYAMKVADTSAWSTEYVIQYASNNPNDNDDDEGGSDGELSEVEDYESDDEGEHGAVGPMDDL